MVPVNGVGYHLLCMGTGFPTLVLEAGLGESSLSWHPAQARLAHDMRVCSYDRAGLGWSNPVDTPMQPGEVAENLHTLLDNADIPPPYVLVGHSRGGIFARAFYHQYPEQTLGIVLVDSTHEQSPLHQYPYASLGYLKQAILIAVAEPLSRIGIVRLLGLADATRHPSPLPVDILAAKTAVQNRTDTARAVVNEISVMRHGLDLSTPPPKSLGDTPLLVLTAGNRIDPNLVEREARRLNKNVEAELALARIERTDQEALARLSANSRQIIVEGSGHFIMYDRTDELVTAVRGFAQSLALKSDNGTPNPSFHRTCAKNCAGR